MSDRPVNVHKSSPETPSEASGWEAVKKRGLDFGLCIRCASQLAWGCQNGFTTVHPPCEACAPLVALLPRERPNGWRTVNGASRDGANWPSPTAGDTQNLTRKGSGSPRRAPAPEQRRKATR